MTRLLYPIAALVLLTACEARIGKSDEEKAASAEPADEGTAEAKAGDGQFSIDAPGFAMKFDIPEGLAENAEIDADSGFMYPDATLSGMHIEARKKSAAGRGDSAVDLRFTTKDSPATVAAWYRDPARAADMAITSFAADGDGYAISGTQKDDGDPFTIRLSPRAGGGTAGQVSLRDRG